MISTEEDMLPCYNWVQSLITKHSPLNEMNFLAGLYSTSLFKIPEKSSEACNIEYTAQHFEENVGIR
jgi:hypothetical protein